jgi:hypothetical protein
VLCVQEARGHRCRRCRPQQKAVAAAAAQHAAAARARACAAALPPPKLPHGPAPPPVHDWNALFIKPAPLCTLLLGPVARPLEARPLAGAS